LFSESRSKHSELSDFQIYLILAFVPLVARVPASFSDHGRGTVDAIVAAATGFRHSLKRVEHGQPKALWSLHPQIFAFAETRTAVARVTDLSRPLQTQDASMPQRVDEATAGFFGLTERSILDQ